MLFSVRHNNSVAHLFPSALEKTSFTLSKPTCLRSVWVEVGTDFCRMKLHHYLRLTSICCVINGIVCPSFLLSLLLPSPSLCHACADLVTEMSWLQIKSVLKILFAFNGAVYLSSLAHWAGGGRQPVGCGRCDKLWFRLLEKSNQGQHRFTCLQGSPSALLLFSCNIQLFCPLWVPHRSTGWLPFFKHQRISQILRTEERILHFPYSRTLSFIHISYCHPQSIWIYNLGCGLRGIHSTYRSHFFSRSCSNIRLQACVHLLSLASMTGSFGSAVVQESQGDVTPLLDP